MPDLYIQDLAISRCSTPGCTKDHAGEQMFLHAKCHDGAPLWAMYTVGDGRFVVLRCSLCNQMVARIAVAHDLKRECSEEPSETPSEGFPA